MIPGYFPCEIKESLGIKGFSPLGADLEKEKNRSTRAVKFDGKRENLVMSQTSERSSNFLSTGNSQKQLIINKLTYFLKTS